MRLISDCQPKCIACVDYYHDSCHCPKSIYSGMSMPSTPWEGCTCFLSRRKWDGDDFGRKKKKRRNKWPSLEEFEFGV